MRNIEKIHDLGTEELRRLIENRETFVLYVRSEKDYEKIKEIFDVDVVFPELARSFGDRIAFYRCDIDRAQPLMAELGIYFAPVVLLFKDGKLKEKLEGIKSWAEYNRAVGELIC